MPISLFIETIDVIYNLYQFVHRLDKNNKLLHIYIMNNDSAMSISLDTASKFSARELFEKFKDRAAQVVERLKLPTPQDMYNLAHEIRTLNSQPTSGGERSTDMIVMKTFDRDPKKRYLSLDEGESKGEYRVCDGVQGDPDETVTYIIREDRVTRLLPQKMDPFKIPTDSSKPNELPVQGLELFQVNGKLIVLAGEMIGQNIAKVDPKFTYSHLPKLFPKHFDAAPRR